MDSSSHHQQFARNRDSRDRWIEYATHRTRVTNLLTRPPTNTGRLLVLGAGNCNDLNLSELLGNFAEVHLVDLDLEAMQLGLERQAIDSRSSLVLHGGIDLAGIADRCSGWKHRAGPVDQREIDDAVRAARQHDWSEIDQDFDVSASVGLLSQIIEITIQSLDTNHSSFLDLLSAVRLRHMQLLLESLRPGGRGVLITEIVSSASCPELAQTPEHALAGLLREQINRHNFFTGLNPVVLEALWRSAPGLTPLVEQVELCPPWLWNFGPRLYACCALHGVRRHRQ